MKPPTPFRHSVFLGAIVFMWCTLGLAAPKDLLKAAKRGNAEDVAAELGTGVDVNSMDRKGRTALMMASDRGHISIAEILLDAGADPSRTDRKNRSAIRLARDNKHGDIVELLRFALVKKGDTESGYLGFLKEYPGSKYERRVTDALHAVRWSTATEKESISTYREFIVAYPNSEHIPEARSRLELLEWKLLSENKKSSLNDYRRFLSDYPASAHAAAANKKIEYLAERQSRMSEDGRFRIGGPSTLSSANVPELLTHVKSLIAPLTLSQLSGDDGADGQSSGNISVGGAFLMGMNSVSREDGITVSAMSATSASSSRPSNVGVWHGSSGQGGFAGMLGGNVGEIALRLFDPSEDNANLFRFNRVRLYDGNTEIEYTVKGSVWTRQRYEKSED